MFKNVQTIINNVEKGAQDLGRAVDQGVKKVQKFTDHGLDEIANSVIKNLVKADVPQHRWYVLRNEFQPTSIEGFDLKDKRVAILIRGLFSHPNSFVPLGKFLLKKDKYDHVFCLDYNPGEHNFFPNLSNEINTTLTTLTENEVNQIDLYAHDMGGLLTKYALKNLVDGSFLTKNTPEILDKCKHVFFFGTPHNPIDPHVFEHVADTTSKKITGSIFGRQGQSNLLSKPILSFVQKLEYFDALRGRTNLFYELNTLSLFNNFYNIVGTKNDLKFNDTQINGGSLGKCKISYNGMVDEAHKQINPSATTDGVLSLENVSLISQGLDPSHEFHVNYNHNEIVGIDHEGTVPKEIKHYIKSVLNISTLKKITLIDESTSQIQEGILVAPNAILFADTGLNNFNPSQIKNQNQFSKISFMKRFEDTALCIAFSNDPFIQNNYIDINSIPTKGTVLAMPLSELDLNKKYFTLITQGLTNQYQLVLSEPQNRFIGWITDIEDVDTENQKPLISVAQPECKQWINYTILENILQ